MDEISQDIDMDIGAKSDVGLVRKKNEDHYLVAAMDRSVTVQATNLAVPEGSSWIRRIQGSLLVVADGVGGHQHGEVASSTAVRAIATYQTHVMPWLLQLHEQNEQEIVDELGRALRYCHRRIVSLSSRESSLSKKMGTTLTAAYLVWPMAYIVHAGDSRCYLYRDGELIQVTRDHTLAQKLVDENVCTPEQAARSRYSHVLCNVVGGGSEDVYAEVHRINLQSGDKLLLCSDGLIAHVSDGEIAEHLAVDESATTTCDKLIAAANEGGGTDNTTVVIAHFLE